ncbi:hypothetical protein SLE2022_331180 [Rubroshorea leprosula]
MESGSSSKKRKISQVDQVDDDNEEEKIQKFFALIKSLREAREQLMNCGADAGKKELVDNKRMKSTKLEEPSFRSEDFIGVAPVKESAPAGLVGSSQRSEKEEKAKEVLDLSLSL